MRSLLYIKGIKEPFQLTGEEGKAAEALIADSTQSSDTPFSIEGVWTGLKRDMRYVTFEKEREYKDEDREEIDPEEKEKLDRVRKNTRKWLEEKGIIGKVEENKKFVLLRSELDEYYHKYGKNYEVPEGAEIIEDVI